MCLFECNCNKKSDSELRASLGEYYYRQLQEAKHSPPKMGVFGWILVALSASPGVLVLGIVIYEVFVR